MNLDYVGKFQQRNINGCCHRVSNLGICYTLWKIALSIVTECQYGRQTGLLSLTFGGDLSAASLEEAGRLGVVLAGAVTQVLLLVYVLLGVHTARRP